MIMTLLLLICGVGVALVPLIALTLTMQAAEAGEVSPE
jgi:hypothetical protein